MSTLHTVEQPFSKDGKEYQVGDSIELTAHEAGLLAPQGLVSKKPIEKPAEKQTERKPKNGDSD